jgi:hypothetical protein
VNYEKDDVYGTAARRTLAFPESANETPRPVARTYQDTSIPAAEESNAFGPEAVERAQMMAYLRTKRIQEESPYVREDVVEHVVHDQRLYLGMWVVGGINAVTAFLTFSPVHLGIAAVAVAFALMSSPGRQYRDLD